MKGKTRKIRKNRGNKTGYGSKKKHRGSGSRGGRGGAGLHKYKWSWTLKNDPDHYGGVTMKSRTDDLPVINLAQINQIALNNNITEIDLSEYKVLGTGKLTQKLVIKAHNFSQKAIERIEAAGGKAEALAPVVVKDQAKSTDSEEPDQPAEENGTKKPAPITT